MQFKQPSMEKTTAKAISIKKNVILKALDLTC